MHSQEFQAPICCAAREPPPPSARAAQYAVAGTHNRDYNNSSKFGSGAPSIKSLVRACGNMHCIERYCDIAVSREIGPIPKHHEVHFIAYFSGLIDSPDSPHPPTRVLLDHPSSTGLNKYFFSKKKRKTQKKQDGHRFLAKLLCSILSSSHVLAILLITSAW